jgi:hypothetical protein
MQVTPAEGNAANSPPEYTGHMGFGQSPVTQAEGEPKQEKSNLEANVTSIKVENGENIIFRCCHYTM